VQRGAVRPAAWSRSSTPQVFVNSPPGDPTGPLRLRANRQRGSSGCGFGLGRDGLFDYLEVRERAEVVSRPPRNVGDPPGVVGDPLPAAAGSCELVQGRPEVTPGFV
jgi:hypothetical protein